MTSSPFCSTKAPSPMAFSASMNAQLSLLIVLLTASFSRLHFSQILLSSLHTDQPLLCYLFSTQQQKLKAIRNLMRHNERCFTKGRHEVRSSAERGALHMDSELWQLTTSRLCSQEQAADLEPLRWLSKLFGAHCFLESGLYSWILCSRCVPHLSLICVCFG